MDLHGLTDSPPIRVLLVDDHPAIRHGLALLLAPEGMHVCATAAGRADALARVEECQANLAIVDLSLEGEDGFALITDLRQRGVRVLVYSMHDDARRVSTAVAAGAVGYVTKRESQGVLVEAIREVAAGRDCLSPRAAAALATSLPATPIDDPLARLSAQEREVYEMLTRGETSPDIAVAMGIGVRTVDSYCARILVKLGLTGMKELRRHAIDHFQGRSQ